MIQIEGESVVIEDVVFPAVGFGTYPLKGEMCERAVSAALGQGYRIIDTATYYENFAAIASAIQGWKCDELYLISKVWPDSHTEKLLKKDFTRTLDELQIEYLDAYFLHWPNSSVPLSETLSAMGALKQRGLLRHIGLSNVTHHHLRQALDFGLPISWVQVEMHAHFYDEKLLKMCAEEDIGVQAWRPLDQARLCSDPLLKSIGENYDKSAAQVALRWIHQKGVIPLPGSTNPQHIADNCSIFDFRLTDEEEREISSRAVQGQRLRLTLEGGLGFADEFDYSFDQCWPE